MPSVYEIITDRIIEKLEQGVVPWQRPWSSPEGYPKNLISGKDYRGVNIFLLSCQGFSSPYWVTYKQAKQLGGYVQKGARSTPCIFWKWIEEEDENQGIKSVPILRYYRVFNVEQCEDIEHTRLREFTDSPPKVFNSIETCEKIVDNYVSPPTVSWNGGNRAFYMPVFDSIHMPKKEAFTSEAGYYSTLFHELIHSTGHVSRLNRSGVANPSRFGSHEYSEEELIAEMGAAFLNGLAGIDCASLSDNSAAYVASWLKVLRGDKKLVVLAGAKAQKAVDRIVGEK